MPRGIVIGGLVLTIVCAMLVPGVHINQKFNKELPATHPVAVSQQILEDEFGGFLGPELSIRRMDGGNMTDVVTTRKLNQFTRAVRDLHAIRDMGLVAAVTILTAMLADLVLLPAVCTATRQRVFSSTA